MNELDDKTLDKRGFAYRDILGQDRWDAFSVDYSFATATGLTLVGRMRIVGKQCFWQVKSSGTSMATTAGTSYITLPVAASAGGYGGVGTMTNDTGNTPVGVGHVDVANSRFYPPTQAASANTFIFAGWHEVA